MKKLNFIFSLVALCFMLNCSSDDSNNDDPIACDTAIANTLEALGELNTAGSNDFTQKCNAYKNALENQIDSCGDQDGDLQALINGLGDCSLDVVSSSVEALMTANIAGEQFNLMRPNGFNLFNSAIGMVTYSYFSDEDYIRIQGNSTYQNIAPTEFTKEITIWIPQSSWAVGTYTLADSVVDNLETGATPTPHYGIVYFNNDEYSQAFEEEGSITITEFNLEDRVIRGTFEFTFVRSGNNDEIGPFECMNGTFDYSLDDDYFD